MWNRVEIPADIRSGLAEGDPFEALMTLSGQPFRDVPGRKTLKIIINNRTYFIKQHFGVGWKEIFKALLNLKRPVLSALTEVNAINQLKQLGITTTPLVAFGCRGLNPARLQSFVMTEDLGDIVSLETLCATWPLQPPPLTLRRHLIVGMATLSRKLHAAGLCHRDYYLCHIVLKAEELTRGNPTLILIDLHRMVSGQSPHGETVMKDIAGLMFSAMDAGFTEEDWALFKSYYLPQSNAFWEKVESRKQKLYAKYHSAKFQARLAKERQQLE